jgi:hypothetical protein
MAAKRRGFFRKAWKGLLVGHTLPALVLLGIWIGLEAGGRYAKAYVFAFMLIGGLLGMVVGLCIVVAALKRLYPPRAAESQDGASLSRLLEIAESIASPSVKASAIHR